MSTFCATYIVEFYAAPWNNGEDFEFINNGKIFMVLAVSQTAGYKRYGKHDAYFYTKVRVIFNRWDKKIWLLYHFLTWDLCESPWQEPPYVNSAFLFIQKEI